MEHDHLEVTLDEELENQLLMEAVAESLGFDDTDYNTGNKKPKSRSKKKKKHKYTASYIKSGLKAKTVLMLLVTLIVNTYAWFVYIARVSVDIKMHVKDWNFELSTNDQTETIDFVVEEIYPGMPDAVEELNASNTGEMTAKIVCDISYVKILDEVYEKGGTYEVDGEMKTFTSEDLINKLINDYPFKVGIYLDDVLYDGSTVIMPTGDSTVIKIMVTWDYETGDDENTIAGNDTIDTYWGNKAYQYRLDNPDDPYGIHIKAIVQAEQNDGGDDTGTDATP